MCQPSVLWIFGELSSRRYAFPDCRAAELLPSSRVSSICSSCYSSLRNCHKAALKLAAATVIDYAAALELSLSMYSLPRSSLHAIEATALQPYSCSSVRSS